jgi:hypothetical protein
MYVDLGAERVLTAEKGNQRIAAELKTFSGASEVYDLSRAVGQYFLYRSVLARTDPDRVLYLAVHSEVYNDVFEASLGQLMREDYGFPLLVFDVLKEEVVRWIPEPKTGS